MSEGKRYCTFIALSVLFQTGQSCVNNQRASQCVFVILLLYVDRQLPM